MKKLLGAQKSGFWPKSFKKLFGEKLFGEVTFLSLMFRAWEHTMSRLEFLQLIKIAFLSLKEFHLLSQIF